MHNPVHILMADILHFSCFVYVLPDNPVFIFNVPFLPRGVRIREVDGCFQSLADPLVAGEFSFVVCSDGLDDVLERLE